MGLSAMGVGGGAVRGPKGIGGGMANQHHNAMVVATSGGTGQGSGGMQPNNTSSIAPPSGGTHR